MKKVFSGFLILSFLLIFSNNVLAAFDQTGGKVSELLKTVPGEYIADEIEGLSINVYSDGNLEVFSYGKKVALVSRYFRAFDSETHKPGIIVCSTMQPYNAYVINKDVNFGFDLLYYQEDSTNIYFTFPTGLFNTSRKNYRLNAEYKFYRVGNETNEPETSEEENETVTIYRINNKFSGEHLFTPSIIEVRELTNSDWEYEGIVWNAPITGDPVYRLYNAEIDDHLYTKDENEKNTLLTRGWIADFSGEPIFYSGGSTPIYRMYNEISHRHLLTLDINEYNVLTKSNWVQEGEALSALQ